MTMRQFMMIIILQNEGKIVVTICDGISCGKMIIVGEEEAS